MQDDERHIRQLVATWMAATRDGDIGTILSLMSDDVVFLVPGRPVMRKADFAAAAQAQGGPDAPRFDGHSEIQEIQICGDWAFMWTRLSVQITLPSQSKPLARAGHTLSVLKRENGNWVLARDANLLVPVDSPAE